MSGTNSVTKRLFVTTRKAGRRLQIDPHAVGAGDAGSFLQASIGLARTRRLAEIEICGAHRNIDRDPSGFGWERSREDGADGEESDADAPTSIATTAPLASTTTRSTSRLFRIAAGVLLVAMLLLGYFLADKRWLSERTNGGGHAIAPASIGVSNKSIAVLPFVDMSEKKDQEYFADGMAEEIIDSLSKVPELYVPARTSSFYFKGKQTKISDIAGELGVAHVLEGSVRKAGNKLRITAQLIRADNGYHLWSETFDRELDDIFKVQDEIAGAVVRALRVSLLDGTAARQNPTSSTEAYTLYLQARSIALRAGQADYDAAIGYLRQALRLDPKFAAAWAELANDIVDEFQWIKSRPAEDSRAEAHKAAAQRYARSI